LTGRRSKATQIAQVGDRDKGTEEHIEVAPERVKVMGYVRGTFAIPK